jgi:hypothetical protein
VVAFTEDQVRDTFPPATTVVGVLLRDSAAEGVRLIDVLVWARTSEEINEEDRIDNKVNVIIRLNGFIVMMTS